MFLLILTRQTEIIFQLQNNITMNSKFTLRISAILIIAIIFLSGCASSTMINSIPSGAKVFINGQVVGTTPYLYQDTKVLGSVVNVDLVKEGYEPLYTSFRRTEEFNIGTFIGGCFIWPFWLWTMDYNPTHTYELVPTSLLN